jgi:uncharacterized protein (TIGR00288 family)
MIDFDNVTLGIRSDLQNQLKRLLNSEIIKGKVAVQRAYADWRRYPQYIVPLSEASIDLIFAPAFGSNKKNATDIRLAIDALELVFTRPEIGTFILLSGDSDFSSLVLKLKEYGKYIIGVGIRESSSDLLIQNCDEYYSYTEVTGLAREGEGEPSRRDPWELVVEAVTQMKKEDDVMRSDRLKQVMQTIDPNFSEKDAGFSRFSRFVVEAAQRGLLSLQKMENGQYAIDLGENANVPPEEEAKLKQRESATSASSQRPRRKRAPRARETEEATRQLTLAEGFELLRQALLVLGAVDEESCKSDEVRTKMVELLGDESDPVFARSRFQRLLRQAHDANLIELAKEDDGAYALRLGPEALAEPVQPAEPPPPDAKSEEGTAESEEPSTTEKKPRARRAPARKTSRGRGRTPQVKAAEEAKVTEEEPVAEAPASQKASADAQTKRRNPRYRRGSRGGAAKTRKETEDKPSEENKAVKDPAPEKPHKSRGARSLGPRTGSRSRRTPASPGEASSEGAGKKADAPDEQVPRKPEQKASGGTAKRAKKTTKRTTKRSATKKPTKADPPVEPDTQPMPEAATSDPSTLARGSLRGSSSGRGNGHPQEDVGGVPASDEGS